MLHATLFPCLARMLALLDHACASRLDVLQPIWPGIGGPVFWFEGRRAAACQPAGPRG